MQLGGLRAEGGKNGWAARGKCRGELNMARNLLIFMGFYNCFICWEYPLECFVHLPSSEI